MRASQAFDVDVRERVAVDDEKRVGINHRQRQAWTSGAAENLRLFPRIPYARTEIVAVTDYCCDRLGAMMQVEHQIGNAARDEPADDPANDRIAGDRDRRFGADVGESAQASAEACGEHEGVAKQRPYLSRLQSSSKSMSVAGMPRDAQSST